MSMLLVIVFENSVKDDLISLYNTLRVVVYLEILLRIVDVFGPKAGLELKYL